MRLETPSSKVSSCANRRSMTVGTPNFSLLRVAPLCVGQTYRALPAGMRQDRGARKRLSRRERAGSSEYAAAIG